MFVSGSGTLRGLRSRSSLLFVASVAALGTLVSSGAESGTSAPAPKERPVAIFWIGADGGASVVPPLAIEDIAQNFESNGFRVLRVDGASPKVLSHSLLVDKKRHPEGYEEGRVIPFVIHGTGLLSASGGAPLPNGTFAPISDADLMAAFLVGIGPTGKADISMSACVVGRTCKAVPLDGTSLGERVTRLLVPVTTTAAQAKAIAKYEERKKQVGRLLEVALRALGRSSAVEETKSWKYGDERLENSQKPGPRSLSDIARREQFVTGASAN